VVAFRFGLALAQWLVQKGARFLLLTSKRGLRTGAQAKAIRQLQNQGIKVRVLAVELLLLSFLTAQPSSLFYFRNTKMANLCGLQHMIRAVLFWL